MPKRRFVLPLEGSCRHPDRPLRITRPEPNALATSIFMPSSKTNRSSVNLPVHRLLPLRETIFSPASMGEALAIASLDELSV
jgi:hypothetical protein